MVLALNKHFSHHQKKPSNVSCSFDFKHVTFFIKAIIVKTEGHKAT